MAERDEIIALPALEAVRRRPAMYVGDVRDGTGRETLVWHVVESSVAQHLLVRARTMRVDIDEGWVTVEDDAERDWAHPRTVDHVVSELVSGWVSWREHHPGLELAIVNALSESMTIDTTRADRAWLIETARGTIAAAFADVGRCRRPGTRIRFRPDASVFGDAPFDLAPIERRLRELAWLNPLLAITWRGEVLPGHGGIAEWARVIAGSDVIARQRRLEAIDVDVALAWRMEPTAPEIHSFVNQRRTTEHGTHVAGLMDAIPEPERAGLVAIVSVLLDAPSFSSQARDRLVDRETPSPVRAAVARVVASARL